MAHEIQFTSDSTGSLEKARGSDSRFNVSSRQDSRSYYNSRDKSQAFSLVWDDASSAAGDYIVYWKNTDTTGKHFVVDSVGVNSISRADFCLMEVTGTATGGVASPPVCLNRASPRVAQSTARTADTSPILGLTSGVIIDHVSVTAGGHEEFRLHDRLRIGQDSAIALKCHTTDTSPTRSWGVVFGFYE
jgi:hypothetical protein